LSVAAGMAVGIVGSHELRAQSKPPVYFIGEIDVTNPEVYAKEYLPKAKEIIKAHGGLLLAAGGAAGSGVRVIPVDGEPRKRVVIYQYPSMEAVHAWRNDPDYQQVRKVGEKYATYRTFVIEGLQP